MSADLALFPSPVPDQVGRTNHVDNTRIAASLGFEAEQGRALYRMGWLSNTRAGWTRPRSYTARP